MLAFQGVYIFWSALHITGKSIQCQFDNCQTQEWPAYRRLSNCCPNIRLYVPPYFRPSVSICFSFILLGTLSQGGASTPSACPTIFLTVKELQCLSVCPSVCPFPMRFSRGHSSAPPHNPHKKKTQPNF